MSLLVVVVLSVVLAGPGLWFWFGSIARGSWRRSAGWFAVTAVLLLAGTGITYLVGALAGASLDPEEACHSAGQRYDADYRAAHFGDYSRWFPLHNPCHAGYDLVPAWVNPTLVVLPALAAGCLACSARLAVVHRRTENRRTKKGTP